MGTCFQLTAIAVLRAFTRCCYRRSNSAPSLSGDSTPTVQTLPSHSSLVLPSHPVSAFSSYSAPYLPSDSVPTLEGFLSNKDLHLDLLCHHGDSGTLYVRKSGGCEFKCIMSF